MFFTPQLSFGTPLPAFNTFKWILVTKASFSYQFHCSFTTTNVNTHLATLKTHPQVVYITLFTLPIVKPL